MKGDKVNKDEFRNNLCCDCRNSSSFGNLVFADIWLKAFFQKRKTAVFADNYNGYGQSCTG
jgi:hypothetical protein